MSHALYPETIMIIEHVSDLNTPLVMLTVASVPIPASSDGKHPADTHLVGIGLIIARPREEGWRTETHIRTIAAGQSEAVLIEQVAGLLPAKGILSGWRIAEAVLPPLLGAASAIEPGIAEAFLQSLAMLATELVIDLAICPVEGLGAPLIPRHDPTPGWPALADGIIESAWATGRPEAVEFLLRAQVETLWRMWLDRFQQRAPRESA